MEDKIKIRTKKTTYGSTRFWWKEKKMAKGETVDNCIKKLQEKRTCFKVISSNFEKHYEFNGNNYLITEFPKN